METYGRLFFIAHVLLLLLLYLYSYERETVLHNYPVYRPSETCLTVWNIYKQTTALRVPRVYLYCRQESRMLQLLG